MNRYLINCSRLNNSSIEIPEELSLYKKSFKKLFLHTCKKHGLEYLHVELFFFWDAKSRLRAKVSRNEFGFFQISFNMALIENVEDFVEAWEHELCHVEQLCKGRLEYKKNCVVWNGKEKYSFKQLKKEYHKLPWEKEARREEKNFFHSLHLIQSKKMIEMFSICAIKKVIKDKNIKKIDENILKKHFVF